MIDKKNKNAGAVIHAFDKKLPSLTQHVLAAVQHLSGGLL